MFGFIVNHLLGHIPTWVWPFAAGAGFATFIIAGIAQHIEPVRIYALIARPIAIVVMVVGIFFYGGAGVLEIQQEALKDAEQKMALLQQQSDAATAQLAQALKTNENLIKGHAFGVHQQAEQNRVVINKECTINDVAFDTYNRAVKNQATTGFVTVGTPK